MFPKTNYQKQTETNNLFTPHPPASPHHPPKCKNFSRWRRYPAAINSRKYEKRKEQHQQNRGMKFHREGENEK